MGMDFPLLLLPCLSSDFFGFFFGFVGDPSLHAYCTLRNGFKGGFVFGGWFLAGLGVGFWLVWGLVFGWVGLGVLVGLSASSLSASLSQ